METTKKNVGERVREIRKARGFKSADALATALEMSATSVYELERGDNWISPEMLTGLVSVLKVPAGAFFEDIKAPIPAESDLRALLGILATLEDDQVADLLDRARKLEAVARTRKTGELPNDPVQRGGVAVTPKRKPV